MKISVLLLLLVTVISVDQTLSVLPGFQLRLTQKGLEYGNSVAQRYLSKLLNGLTIPDYSGNKGSLQYRLSGIRNKRVKVPTSRMVFAPSHNGLSWSLTGLDLDVFANWNVKYKKGWFKFSVSGGVDVELERASIQVTLGVGQSGGRPQVSMTRCSMSVGNVDIRFHGGTAFILNLFRGIVGNKVKDLMESRVCDLLKDVVNKKANEKLNDLKVNVELDNRFLLDYSLVRNPSIQSNVLETQHKGEVFWKKDVKEAPFTPKPIPPLADQSRMLYVWLTDYVAKTALTTAHEHKYLAYTITKHDFTGVYQSYLNTTCEDLCVGKIIEQIGIKFPYSQVAVSASSHETPSVTIAPSGITATAKANLNLFAIRPDDTAHNLIELRAEVTASVVGSVVNERLTGRITSQRLKFSVTKSPIGTIDTSVLNKVLTAILDYGAVPWGNVILKKGIDLPLTGIIHFKNAQITLLDGVAVIATDLDYKGNF